MARTLKLGEIAEQLDAQIAVADATALAQAIADKPASTVKIGKEAFYKQLEMPLAEAYDYAAAVMVENMLNRDAEEGIGAFIDKRTPNWSS